MEKSERVALAFACNALSFLVFLAALKALRLPVAGGAAVCLLLWMWAARRWPALSQAFESEPAEAHA